MSGKSQFLKTPYNKRRESKKGPDQDEVKKNDKAKISTKK